MSTVRESLIQGFETAETLAVTGLGVGAVASIASSKKAQEAFSKLPGANALAFQQKRDLTLATMSVTRKNQTLSRSLVSQIMTLEEASPLHIMRTFQLSNLFQPFLKNTANDEAIHISGRSLNAQKFYYEKLLEFNHEESKRKYGRALKAEDLKRGMYYMNNKLYGADANGVINKADVLLHDARLVLANQKNGQIYSQNHLLRKYSEMMGAKIDFQSARENPLLVMGSNSKVGILAKQAKSYFNYGFEIGLKTLDNPLGGVEDLLSGAGANYSGLFQSKFYQRAKALTNIQLGTQGVYNLSTPQSLKIMSKNIAKKSALAYLTYQGLDSIVRNVAGPQSDFSNGIFAGVAGLYAKARIGFAKIWSDKFQGYKERQEQAAQGSTSLGTLVGLPLAGALVGSQIAYFSRINEAVRHGTEASANKYSKEFFSKPLSKLGINKPVTIMRRNALLGGLVGAALALPFLPGALIGQSSEELKAIYSGQKEVAMKANRFWVFGGNKYDGAHTKFFKQSWVSEARNEAHTKAVYGSAKEKKNLNPFLKPFAYLRDPYRFEKRHQDTMPYPIWGMEVSYGSFLGKIFERTVGQIIKPDVVNPRLKKQLREEAKQRNASGQGQQVQPSIFMKRGIKERSYTNSLIKDGLMKEQESAGFSPNKEGLLSIYQSTVDFTGFKGWMFSMLADKVVDRTIQKQLSRSGEATNSARRLREENLGDMVGFGEFQRRLLGTSTGSLPDRQNLLRNNMPSWLPNDPSKYFIDFSVGNPFQSVEKGATRLPGKGFAALNPEVTNLTADKYPLIYQYKILADVAKGSEEHIKTRRALLDHYKKGHLSKREEDILVQTLDQEVARDNRKSFKEDNTNVMQGPIGEIHKNLWGIITKLDNPLEMLTPWRPLSKFVHQRTAIEDYKATQLGGADTAIWTNPYSHFIKPALNKLTLGTIGQTSFVNFKPEETKEKEAINEYFDKLKVLKNAATGNLTQASKTVAVSSLSGLTTKDSVLKFKSALSSEQRDYFESFSKEKDEKKREQILAMLPTDVARGYQQIWKNLDIATKTKINGGSVQKKLANTFLDDTRALMGSVGSDISLTKDDKEEIQNTIDTDTDQYANMGFSKKQRFELEEAGKLRQKLAIAESASYIRNATGTPDSKFMGWDPRLTVEDIKIKTLSLGKEDLRRFGFWKGDEERMNRITAFDKETQVIHDLEKIKQQLRKEQTVKQEIDSALFKKGFKTSRIKLSEADLTSLYVKDETKKDY